MTDQPAQGDGLNTPVIALVGVVSAILTFAVIIGVQVLYYHVAAAQNEVKVIEARNEEADSKLAEQDAKLAEYRRLDPAQGRVALKIERAMALVVDETQKQQKTGGER
jgi:hypothetical protein